LYGLQSTETSTLLHFDGSTFITDNAKNIERWTKHFQSVLNRPSLVNEAITALKEVYINLSLNEVQEN
jgi:hypothetical protein